MAELLIRVSDITDPDQATDYAAAKGGDVIAVCPDGWAWSDRERTNPDWRIVAIPSFDPSDADAVVRSELPVSDDDIAPKRFRIRRVDVEDLPLAIQTILAKPRKGTGVDFTVTAAAIKAYIRSKS